MLGFLHVDDSEIDDSDVKDILDANFSIRILWLSNSLATQASIISLQRARNSSPEANFRI
jgi:hypothetical protein